MGMNFPNAPIVGQQFPSPAVAGQPVWQWDGEKWTAGPPVSKVLTYQNFLGGIDLNTVTDDGHYVTDGACPNAPGAGQWYLHVSRYHADALSAMQIAYRLYAGDVQQTYYRTKFNPSGWTPWQSRNDRIVSTGNSAALTNATPARCSLLTLPAGIWDIEGYADFSGAGATSSGDWWAVVATVDAAMNSGLVYGIRTRRPSALDIFEHFTLPRIRVSPTVSTNYYFNAQASFSGGSYAVNGAIWGVRII